MKYNCVNDILFSSEGSEPVTLEEIKNYLRVDGSLTTDDDMLTELGKTARSLCEKYVNQSIITRTVKSIVNNSLGGIVLPYQPYVSGIVVKDYDGNTIDSNNVEFKGASFKRLFEPVSEYLECTYLAGYSTCPSHFKTAILQQLAWMYENRGDAGLSEIVMQTLKPYRIES